MILWHAERSIMLCKTAILFLLVAGCGGETQSEAEAGTEIYASLHAGTYGITVDETHVYWANAGEGSIMKAPLGGGTPSAVVSGLERPVAVVVDDENIYWTQDTDAEGGGPVMMMPLDGGSPTRVGQRSNGGGAAGIAIDATHIYWAERGNVLKRPIAGGERVVLAEDRPFSIASVVVDATSVYWKNTGSGVVGAGAVRKVSINGGEPVTLADDLGGSEGLAVDDTYVYFGDDYNRVMRVPLDGGMPVRAASRARGRSAPKFIAVDDECVYWANSLSGTVEKSILGGKFSAVLAEAAAVPMGIALSEEHVYWTEYGSGEVRMAPK